MIVTIFTARALHYRGEYAQATELTRQQDQIGRLAVVDYSGKMSLFVYVSYEPEGSPSMPVKDRNLQLKVIVVLVRNSNCSRGWDKWALLNERSFIESRSGLDPCWRSEKSKHSLNGHNKGTAVELSSLSQCVIATLLVYVHVPTDYVTGKCLHRASSVQMHCLCLPAWYIFSVSCTSDQKPVSLLHKTAVHCPHKPQVHARQVHFSAATFMNPKGIENMQTHSLTFIS